MEKILYLRGGVLYKIVKFGYHCIVSYWFLWAVLYCSIGSILVFKIVNRKLQIVCLTLLLLATFFTPDLFNSECYKFMFPCFISGYYMKEYGNQIKNTFDYKKGLLIGAVLFTALFMFYKRNGYIYIGYWSLLRKGAVGIFIWDIYRTIIGIIGSVCILLSVRIFIPLKENGVIQEIGKNSMGIYIISMQLNIVLRWLAVRFNITWWGMIIETIAILAISYLTTKVISKIKILNFLLLGRRKNE